MKASPMLLATLLLAVNAAGPPIGFSGVEVEFPRPPRARSPHEAPPEPPRWADPLSTPPRRRKPIAPPDPKAIARKSKRKAQKDARRKQR